VRENATLPEPPVSGRTGRPRRPSRICVTLLAGTIAVFPSPVSLSAPPPGPSRIASLNLTSDELLVEILPKGRLVMATSFADDPAVSNIVGRVPLSVSRVTHANLEQLLELKPDLVVVSEFTDADFLHLLVASGLRYHRMEKLSGLEGIRQAMLDLGGAVGAQEAMRSIVARFDDSLRALRELLVATSRPRVLYWSDPHTAGAGTVTGAIIEEAGAINVGRELGIQGVLPIGAERAFLANPDFVLIAKSAVAREALERHPTLSRLPAVRAGRVIEMPGRLLLTLSHHAAEASWFLAHALHPDRVRLSPQ